MKEYRYQNIKFKFILNLHMVIDDKTLQERFNKLMRKDVKIITSKDIRELYEGLTKEQKAIVNRNWQNHNKKLQNNCSIRLS